MLEQEQEPAPSDLNDVIIVRSKKARGKKGNKKYQVLEEKPSLLPSKKVIESYDDIFLKKTTDVQDKMLNE